MRVRERDTYAAHGRTRRARQGQTMQTERPTVIVTRRLPETVEARMGELFDVRLNEADTPFRQAELVEAVRTADVLVPTITDRLDAAVLGQTGERLKLIANFGNGVDHIDLSAAEARGITVTNTPGVLTADTADMTMALILAVPRRLGDGAEMPSLYRLRFAADRLRIVRRSGGDAETSPSSRYPTQILTSSRPSSTSSFVTQSPVSPFVNTARFRSTASNQPQRRARPVVAPNSAPTRLRCRPMSSSSSVGNGPAPTRVA